MNKQDRINKLRKELDELFVEKRTAPFNEFDRLEERIGAILDELATLV